MLSSGNEIAAISLLHSMQRSAVIGQNIANVNTNGYKRQQFISAPFDLTDVKKIRQLQLSDNSAGVLKETGLALDVAIEGDGFFAIETPEGVRYTRNGQFIVNEHSILSVKGMENYLVKGASGAIVVHNPHSLRIDLQGKIYDNNALIGQLKVFNLPDKLKIHQSGLGVYSYVGSAETLPISEYTKIRQGFVEASNVQTGQEMVSLLETLRYIEGMQKIMYIYQDVNDKSMRVFGDLS